MVTLHNADCLDVMGGIPDKSVDLILCDLPFQTTACSWDTLIPFEPLWAHYRRLIKPYGAIVLFGREPFSSKLRLSNLEWFKYDWVWEKSRALGFTNAKNKPLNSVEYVSVFSEGTTANCSNKRMPYYPQGLIPYGKAVKGVKRCAADLREGSHGFGRKNHKESYVKEFSNYPTQVLRFASEPKPVHPTQKPVPLLEYLIKTYTVAGETVLDNCMGVGSTGVAAVNTGRKFIGVEKHTPYFEIAEARITGAGSQMVWW
jgi:site-specific DNA-methyltransferase (adenine-specific)